MIHFGETIYDTEEYPFVSCKKAKAIRKNPGKHIPNKNEASVLRKIMSETGMTEDQIRQIKKYRKILSDAQDIDQKAKRNYKTKIYQKIIKRACGVTGLVPQHPETLKVIDSRLKDGTYNWVQFQLKEPLLTAENIVKFYAK